MPLYEYTCRDCDHGFEALVFGDEVVECPECQGANVGRLLSLPARPQAGASNLSPSCGDPSLPPCGAPSCQRQGK